MIFQGFVIAFSGFVNPERSDLRKIILEHGARYSPCLIPEVTHLIARNLRTPKSQKTKNIKALSHIKILSKEFILDSVD